MTMASDFIDFEIKVTDTIHYRIKDFFVFKTTIGYYMVCTFIVFSSTANSITQYFVKFIASGSYHKHNITL